MITLVTGSLGPGSSLNLALDAKCKNISMINEILD
jgi:hypothetical protein